MIKKLLLISCLFVVFPLKAQAQEDLDNYLKLGIRSYNATMGTVVKDLSLWLFNREFCRISDNIVVRSDENNDFSKDGCYLIYGPEDLNYLNLWSVTALKVEHGEKSYITFSFRLVEAGWLQEKMDFAYIGYIREVLELTASEFERLFVEIFR